MGKFRLRIAIYAALTVLLSLCTPLQTRATHVYGADLYYTLISGTTYSVTLVVYGDCQASPNIFNSLYIAKPQIQIYNGAALFTTINLDTVSPAGVEVTPVCPLDSSMTACKGISNPIPGVMRFTYRGMVNLVTTSANWIFDFNGSFGPGTSPGRSATITNVSPAGTLSLVATLNNTGGPNSSPVYTTIPTPFFCIGRQANYTPGAVDANGDSLSFALVAPINPGGGTVSYLPPYSATQPLSVVPGSQVFNSTNGQFSFIPNIIQRALVVYTVSEYRNGTLVGTSQREMTYVVLNNCSTASPSGGISNPSSTAINVIDSTDVNICGDVGQYSFQINPYSPTGNNITVTAAGLPAGSSYNITGNGTTMPDGTFSWYTTGVAPGRYTFFLTYIDNGCPLSSKQTFTYNITVYGLPKITITQLTPATCVTEAKILVTPVGGSLPWTIQFLDAGVLVQSTSAVIGPFVDSLSPGSYQLKVLNFGSCVSDSNVTIAPPTAMAFTGITVADAACYHSADGYIVVGVGGGTLPYMYELNSLGFNPADSIKNLDVGSYVVHVVDANGCNISGGPYTINQPTPLLVTPVITNSICHTIANGAVSINATGGSPGYTYSFSASAFGPSNTFSSLPGGTYIIHTADTHNCIRDTAVTVVDLVHVAGQYTITQPLCYGQNGGSITVTGISGTAPYQYGFGAGIFAANNSFINLAAGSYTIQIKDSVGCIQDTLVQVTQPSPAIPHAVITPPVCNGGTNGAVTLSGSGGTPGYTFSFNGGALGSRTLFAGLPAGNDSIGIQDANGCTGTALITVSAPPRIVIDSAITINVLCHGGNTGLIMAGGTGGAAPYMYALNSGAYQPNNIITGLQAGSYVLHLEDNNGCERDTVVIISQPPILINSPDSIVNPTCEGFKDGFIMLGTTGGTPIYAYSLSDSFHFSGNPVYSQLSEGSYLFYIRDSHNCTYDTTIILTGYPHIVIDSTAVTNIRCNGGTEGSIVLTTEGGVVPLSYKLNASLSSASDTFLNLPAGSYTILITDSKNCRKETNITLLQPDPLDVAVNITPNECDGNDANGQIAAIVQGGTPPYVYSWPSIANAQGDQVVNLTNGAYNVNITDAHNCADSALAVVSYDNCCKPWLPNAFTPNGDGKDDVFRIHYTGDLKLEAFWIYDRFGKRIFIANDINQGWDGLYNGVSQNMDTYFYYVKGVCGNKGDHEVVLKGDVTLIR